MFNVELCHQLLVELIVELSPLVCCDYTRQSHSHKHLLLLCILLKHMHNEMQ